MKIVDAGYEIVQMPEGEEALRIIEAMGRIAYKSEDKIDDGMRPCPACQGKGQVYPAGPDWPRACPMAGDILKDGKSVLEQPRCINGRAQLEEPSSHKFVRMILKAERKAKMILMAKQLMDARGLDAYAATGIHYEKAQGEYCEELVQNIIDYMRQNPAHESVIEHCSASVKFTSNRGFTHELVRHRLASFTQESTRYCDYDKGKFGGEISVINRTFWGKRPEDRDPAQEENRLKMAEYIWLDAMKDAERHYKSLRALGIPPEISRDVLNNALKADIGTSANFREWRHIFALRNSPRAHPDMRQLMAPLHEEFKKRIPVIFDEV